MDVENTIDPHMGIGVRGQNNKEKYTKYVKTLLFFVYESWEPLDSVKIFPRGTATFATPGKAIPGIKNKTTFLDMF